MAEELIYPINSTQQLLTRLAVVIPELQSMLQRIEEAGDEVCSHEDRDTFFQTFCLRYSEILSDYTINIMNKLRTNPRTRTPMPMKQDEISQLKIMMFNIIQYGLQIMPYIRSFLSMLMSGFADYSSGHSFYPRQLETTSSLPNISTVRIEEIE